MGKGKRYNGSEQKLNIKKVIAVIITLLVVVMFIAIIVKIINSDDTSTEKKPALAYYVVYDNQKWGVINSSGETIINPSYDEMIIIPNKERDVFIVTYNVDYTNNTYESKAVNSKKQDLFTNYDKVEAIQNYDRNNNIWYETSCLKVQKDGKYGLIDMAGNELLSPQYDDITPIIGVTQSLVTTLNGQKGLVSTTGSVIIDNQYAEITTLTDNYEDGYLVRNSDGNYGVIGTNKRELLPIEYSNIEHVYGTNTYIVGTSPNYQIINTSNDQTTSISYDGVKSINNGNIIVQRGDQYGIISSTGEELVAPQYDSLEYIFQNYYIASNDGKYGVINTNNEVQVELKYNYLTYISTASILQGETDGVESDLLDTSFAVRLTGIVSEINTNRGYLKLRTDSDYEYYNFRFEKVSNRTVLTDNTLFLDKKDGKYGYVDKNGVVVINYVYDDALEQNASGFVAVKKDGKWGAINSKGETVVEPTYTLDNNTVIDFIGEWHLAEDTNAGYYTK